MLPSAGCYVWGYFVDKKPLKCLLVIIRKSQYGVHVFSVLRDGKMVVNSVCVGQSIHFVVRHIRPEFNCDVSFAPSAAVWIALNPTQVTTSFTGPSDFHLIPPF